MIRPRLFLSYARADLAHAEHLFGVLTDQGCTVWMDRNELLVGDDFVTGLQSHLASSDAIVILLTQRSAESSWCLAELQYALGRGLVVIVVEKDDGNVLPEAVQRMFRDIQRVPWSDAGEKLVPQILRARTRVRRRFLVRISVLLGVAGGLTMLGARLANQINRIDAGRRLDRLVADLHVATEVWSGEEVKARLRPVRDDPDLPGLMQRLADDPALPSPVRVNAWQALVALRDGRQTEWRTYIERIDWKGGQVADVLWANTTFGRGNISGLVAERVRMAGLVFGPGPNAREVGLTLADVHILDADIWFLRIDGTQLLDVVFENCKFRGAQLDLSAAAAVQFVSREKHAVILSTDVAIVEDSWIVYRGEPPEQGVMDLAEPEQELLFDGVQFARVQFEGHLKPAWFRNCHFIDCVFPADLKAADLDPHGNTIEGAWLSRS